MDGRAACFSSRGKPSRRGLREAAAAINGEHLEELGKRRQDLAVNEG